MLEIAKSFFLIVSARNFQLLVGNEKSRIISGTAFILGRHPRNIKWLHTGNSNSFNARWNMCGSVFSRGHDCSRQIRYGQIQVATHDL